MDCETQRLCKEVAENRYRSTPLVKLKVSEASLRGKMPSVGAQAYGATCTAHAVAALVAYHENPHNPPRLSPQFLFDIVKRNEETWLAKNFDSIRNGLEPDAEFRLAYKSQYDRLNLVVRANGGHRTSVAQGFIDQFESQLRENAGVSAGSMLHRCFDAAREVGICREELRPSASVQRGSFAMKTGVSSMPRGLLDDARNHRVVRGLHVFEHPNNVNEIRSMLSGARRLRPMPVCVAVDIFEGCTDGVFSFPEIDEDGIVVNKPLGLHEVLVVGFEDNPIHPGGGSFIVRNSWGADWGDGGYGRMSYAYLEIFCREAGTVLAYRDSSVLAESGDESAPQISGGVCAACGRSYRSMSSIKMTCEADGCRERICFDCWTKNKRRCQIHAAATPQAL